MVELVPVVLFVVKYASNMPAKLRKKKHLKLTARAKEEKIKKGL